MRRRALPSWERNAEGLTKDRTPSPETTKSSENQRFALVLAHKSASCDFGGFAMLAAMRRASSRVSRLAAAQLCEVFAWCGMSEVGAHQL